MKKKWADSIDIKPLAVLCWVLCGFFVLALLFCFIHGFPIPFLEHKPFRAKSLRKPFEFAFIFFLLGFLFHPRRSEILASLRQKAEALARHPASIWVLSGIYSLLFFWEQITKYLSLNLNFIPFLFYDYMLWYFDQGRFCFTGLLHGYYHANLILLVLYPIWKLFQSQWVLQVFYPILISAAAVPFYFWSRDQLKSPLLAWVAAFLYLNYRYLQNLRLISFGIEAFYPLLILCAVYFAAKKREALYYPAVLLGLLIKEDAALYFGGLGFFLLFSKPHRLRGLLTLILSAAGFFFITKIFIPWSGSNILKYDWGNFSNWGEGPKVIGANLMEKPWMVLKTLVWPPEKLTTLFKITSKLLFIPFLSPWFFLVAVSLYPLFIHGGDYFVGLAFHYTAAVLPFLFLAFVDGWRRIRERFAFHKRPQWEWGIVAALIFLNAMNLRPLHFSRDDLATIQLAKSLPPQAIVVTQGHLLPYLGYRKWNFYITWRYAKRTDTQEAYLNPDYYLFDFQANAYPISPEALRGLGESVRQDPQFDILFKDHRRLLFKNNHRTLADPSFHSQRVARFEERV